MDTAILKRPLITEKSMQDAKNGKFSFVVATYADKTTIKHVVQDLFKVHVVDIATSIVKGRKRRVGVRRNEVSVPGFKKAIVKLKTGEKIDLFDIKGE